MNGERYCEYCGSPVKIEARFCPACGQPVRSSSQTGSTAVAKPDVPPTQKVEGPASYPPQYPQSTVSMAFEPSSESPKKTNKTILFVGIIAAVLIICASVTLFAIGSIIFGKDVGFPLFGKATATNESGMVTEYPTLVAPTGKSLTGRQQLSETQFFDDFSSNALNWPQKSDENFACGYQDGSYFIEVKKPDYRQVIFSPVEPLTHLEFTAEVFSGSDNGGFGVACYYQDIENYYFVYFNTGKSNYYLGRFENGKWIDLADPKPFEQAPGPQRYAVDCTPGLMAVYVSGALNSEYEITQPVKSNKMHLSVVTWTDSTGGMKVIFDDVSGYQAMQ